MIDYNLCYTIPMIIKHTRDTLSETYLDAVAIRNTVFVKGQGVPRSIDIDANEAYCIHFVLYDDKGQATATVRLLPNIDLKLHSNVWPCSTTTKVKVWVASS